MAEDEKRKPGRPSMYSEALATTICERIANGESLTAICKDEGIPSKVTVFKWLKEHGEFVNQYARAREMQADHYLDEIFEIADDGSNDWMERQVKGGAAVKAVDQEHIQRSRLRVDTRKWAMAKLAPKKYGEKLDLSLNLPMTQEEVLAKLKALDGSYSPDK